MHLVRCAYLGAQDANLWDVSSAPTIVMTQRGARRAFQDMLCAVGVEVVQFDFLTPEAVAAYCQERGFLQVRLPRWSPDISCALPTMRMQGGFILERKVTTRTLMSVFCSVEVPSSHILPVPVLESGSCMYH